MERKASQEFTQQIADRTVTGLSAVMGNIDDGGDMLHPGAFTKTLQDNASRVRHLWNHDHNAPPTAVPHEIREIGRSELPADLIRAYPSAKGALLVKREYLDTPRGNEVLAGVRAHAINEMSFGYDAVRKDHGVHEGKSIRNLREVRLYETSDVQWGLNPATRAQKGVLHDPKDCPKAAKDTPWDGPAEVAAADVDDLKHMCAWVADDEEDVKSGYKLPHHKHDGGYAVVWNGVKAAMGALMGARGGLKGVPEADRKGIYTHLAEHYREFGEEPPDYKSVQLALTVADARALVLAGVEFKAGRRNSAADEAKIKAVIDALEKGLETLEDLLGTAEPPAEEEAESKALTDRNRALLTKLAIYASDIE